MKIVKRLFFLLVVFYSFILFFNIGYALEFPLRSYIYQDKSWKSYDFEPYGLRGVWFRPIFYDFGKLWLVDSFNIYKMDIKTGKLYKSELVENIKNIYKDKKGILWISALEKLYKVKKGKIIKEINWPDKGKWFSVKQVFEDMQGNLWFLLYNRIIKYDKKSWKLTVQPKIPKGYKLNCFGIDTAGNIYVSCYEEEDVLAGIGRERIIMRNNSDWIAIYENKFGPNMRGLSRFIIPFKENMLVSFTGKGIFLYKDKKFEKFGDKNIGSVVYCAKKDKKGVLWLGTNRGLVKYDNEKFTVLENTYTGIEYNKELKEFRKIVNYTWKQIYSIDFDNKGNLWFSSGSGVGIYKLSGQYQEGK